MNIDLSSLEFHNLIPEPCASGGGLLLPRYPRQVRGRMESPGFYTSEESAGGELRFVTPALHLRVYVTCLTQDGEVAVYRGEFLHSVHQVRQGGLQCIHVAVPEMFARVQPAALSGAFHSDVWRFVFNRGAYVLQGVETFGQPIRPPRAEEKPKLRWLAYGSSITHSSRNGYPHQAARRLGVDVQNKGLSGSCYIEREAADFIAAECEWDLATLELGINMRNQFTAEEFEKRARYLVHRCQEAKPGRPLFLISIFPNAANHLIEPDHGAKNQAEFVAILNRIADENRGKNVTLFDGGAILKNFSSLGVDLLHPSDFGHVLMGENLANLLRPLLPAP